MPRLSTHVLDTASGRPAAGLGLVLWRLEADGRRSVVAETRTNADGRTDQPLMADSAFATGRYELEFHVGDYFRGEAVSLPDPPFIDVVPLRFGIADPQGTYHVPLLVSPWSYSTYRGS